VSCLFVSPSCVHDGNSRLWFSTAVENNKSETRAPLVCAVLRAQHVSSLLIVSLSKWLWSLKKKFSRLSLTLSLIFHFCGTRFLATLCTHSISTTTRPLF
jgi:hypothetical protein